jgi:hypothetical protein
MTDIPTQHKPFTPSCGNCKYFSVEPKNLQQGNCRKNAPICYPVVTQTGVLSWNAFPLVLREQWCGEFSLKKESLI